MTRSFTTLLGSASLAASLVLCPAADPTATPAPAAPPPPRTQPGPARPPRPGATPQVDRMKQLTTQLDLSPEQAEKLKTIMAEETVKRRELLTDTTLTPATRGEKLAAMSEATRKRIRDAKILTDEQWKKWDALREAQRRPQGRPQGQRQGPRQAGDQPRNEGGSGPGGGGQGPR